MTKAWHFGTKAWHFGTKSTNFGFRDGDSMSSNSGNETTWYFNITAPHTLICSFFVHSLTGEILGTEQRP